MKTFFFFFLRHETFKHNLPILPWGLGWVSFYIYDELGISQLDKDMHTPIWNLSMVKLLHENTVYNII